MKLVGSHFRLNLEKTFSLFGKIVHAYLLLCVYTQNGRRREKRGKVTFTCRQEGDPSVQGARILLIEDDKVLRELMERNLRVRHHAVSVAVDAESALKHLHTSTFDLLSLTLICLISAGGMSCVLLAVRAISSSRSLTCSQKRNSLL